MAAHQEGPLTGMNREAGGLLAKTIFYCRTSTGGQKLDLQLNAAKRARVASKHVFTEKASGGRHDRPKLREPLGRA